MKVSDMVEYLEDLVAENGHEDLEVITEDGEITGVQVDPSTKTIILEVE